MKKKHFQVKNMITILRYSNNDEITKKFSTLCDARIIWGGNKTINQFKKVKTHERVREVNFPDRYSICLINADYIKKLSEDKYDKLVQNFFNDTYLVDQNACSSPNKSLSEELVVIFSLFSKSDFSVLELF